MRHPATTASVPFPSAPGLAPLLASVGVAVGLAVGVAVGVAAAPVPVAAQDAEEALENAREQQRDFERFRQSRIPPERSDPGRAGCDEQIGRICIWFGGEGEEDFPDEPMETERARRGLIAVLLETREQVRDPWLIGQLVHYLVEQGDPRMAERMARECGIEAEWWCSALLGYSMHVRGAFVEAEEAFRAALAAMPAEEREWWRSPGSILTEDGRELFGDFDLFWRLSDPLFLVPGNDRLTDHFARLVQVRNFQDAEHPQGLGWDDDIEETLIRYGRIIGWSRTHSPGASGSLVQDTRRMVGHHHPRSRGYLFPEAFLESPSDVPPESWITAPREARTWYAPPYAPDFRGLETQVGRFRRGEEMLVVGAYRPGEAGAAAFGAAVDPFEAPPDRVDAALFLVPEGGGEALEVSGGESRGVFTLRAPPGRYVSSLEVFDEEGDRAWRARQGVKQEPLTPGLVDVSDLLILAEDAPVPESLDEAVPHVRPGVRVGRNERFAVVWEVYGLRVEEPVGVTIGVTRGRPGFLARVGEFLGVVESDRPVEVTFDETGPDRVETVFRAMTLELPDLEPGEYTLHVRLELAGRNPVISSRPIIVE